MQNQNGNTFKPLIIFLSITFTLSCIFYYLIIDAGTLNAGNGLYTFGLMWCPGISALITMFILKRSLKEFGRKWGRQNIRYKAILFLLVTH